MPKNNRKSIHEEELEQWNDREVSAISKYVKLKESQAGGEKEMKKVGRRIEK